MGRIVVIGSESALGQAVAARYAALGSDVENVPLGPTSDPDAIAASLMDRPIAVLIFVDDDAPPATPAALASREDLRSGLKRLAFIPFRLAALLKPALAGAGAKVVLLTRQTAVMTALDSSGRYLERPFRAAAHQLWRSLAAESSEGGISYLQVATDDLSVTDLPSIIDRPPNAMLVDGVGTVLGW